MSEQRPEKFEGILLPYLYTIAAYRQVGDVIYYTSAGGITMQAGYADAYVYVAEHAHAAWPTAEGWNIGRPDVVPVDEAMAITAARPFIRRLIVRDSENSG